MPHLVSAVTQETLPYFVDTLARVAGKPLVVLIGALSLFIAVGATRDDIDSHRRLHICAICICLGVLVPFFYLQNFYHGRLLFTLVPPLLLLSSIIFSIILPRLAAWQRWVLVLVLFLLATEPLYLKPLSF